VKFQAEGERRRINRFVVRQPVLGESKGTINRGRYYYDSLSPD